MPERELNAVELDDVESDVAVQDEDAKAWPPVLEQKDAGFESGDAVEIKDASAGDMVVNVEETTDPFRFKLVGGITGLVDRVNDVVEPGAYTKTLKVRTPKIIKDHEWSQRLGKVLSIKELRPGDPELPKTVANGDPWPKEAGALVADVQLFKKSQAGQEAAERWREYGRDQQFSIGYRVPAGMAVKSKDGVRRIKELDLYEISDVLWGAAPDSTLLPSALSTKVLAGVELESKGVDDEDDVETDVTVDDGDFDVAETAETTPLVPQENDGETATETVAEPQDTNEDTEEAISDEDEEDNTEPPVTREPFDDDDADFDIEEIDFDDPSIDAEAFDAFGDEIAAMVDSDIERDKTPEGRAPSTSDAGEHTADTVADEAVPAQEAPDNAAAVDAVVDGNVGALTDEPETAAPSTGDEVENVAEKALGAIESHVELRAALRIYEGSTEDEKALYGPYIAASAAHAGIAFLLPDDLAAIDVKTGEEEDVETKINTAPLGSRTNGENWVEANGGLPPYVRGVVRGLERNGHSRSRAIALAIGAMRRWARGGGKVNADTRAKAVKALAQWEALKARAAAKRAVKTDAVEVEIEHEEVTGSAERKSMMVPFFAGSMEEVRALVGIALIDSAELGQFEGRPQIVGLFADHVIVTVWGEGGLDMDQAGYSTYKVDFDYDPTEGTVELGKVQSIRITAKTTPQDSEAEADMLETLGGLDAEASDGADSVKHAVTMLDLENKAGRVLSAANAEALKSAYEALGELLAKAGVDVDPGEPDDDVVVDESDVDEKAFPETDGFPEVETTPIEETPEYKMLQLIKLQSAARSRELA